MRIEPTQITQAGPGIDLSNLPEGLSVKMSDPVKDLAYARNAVTLVFDFSAYEQVRLTFQAKESGDEPHAPPPGPFGDDVAFDGVAISTDGTAWYEVRGLRDLSSKDFLAIEVDLDEAIAEAGLFYGPQFKIRFCQYDNMPRLMDGIAIHSIELTGEPLAVDPSLVLHLAMDDRAPNPIVRDRTRNHHQTFLDPGGNPDTEVHSTAGAIGMALAFDGVDDYLRLTPQSHKPYLAENHDFSIAFWWKADGPDPARSLQLLGNYSAAANEESCFLCWTWGDSLNFRIDEYWPGGSRSVSQGFGNGTDGAWHHYALVRQGETIRFHQDGGLSSADTNAYNTVGLAPDSQNITLGMAAAGGAHSPGSFDDFRVYDRALSAEEVAAMV